MAIVPGAISPAIVGVLSPVLVISDKAMEETTLGYAVCHELEHYRKHDLWLKLIMEVTECTQWWNPFFYILKKEFTLAMEISNDVVVVQTLSESERVEYAAYIVKMAREVSDYKPAFSLQLTGNRASNLKTRINYILRKPSSNRVVKYAHFLTIAVAIGITMFILIEPVGSSHVPMENEAVEITPQNAYFVDAGKEYLIYVNGEYFATCAKEDIDWIEGHEKIKIYKRGHSIESGNR